MTDKTISVPPEQSNYDSAFGRTCECGHGIKRHKRPANANPAADCAEPCLDCSCKSFNQKIEPPISVPTESRPTHEELASRITGKIQSLLTDKYTNSFKIACGIIRQELEAASWRCPKII